MVKKNNAKKGAAVMGGAFLLMAAMGVTSCIDSNYDLNKDIDLTVDIEGDGLTIPLGYTDYIKLGSVIEENETLIKGEDGTYAISKKDDIDPVEIDIEDPVISIDNPTFEGVTVNFEDKKVENVSIDNVYTKSTVGSEPNAKVEITNLPKLAEQTQSVNAIDNAGSIPSGTRLDDIYLEVADKQTVSMTYSNFPQDVKEISAVYFGNDNKGQLISFTVDTKDLAESVDNETQTIEEFTIRFPEGFVVKKAGNFGGEITGGNVFKQTNHNFSDKLSYAFYIEKVEFATPLSGSIDYNGEVSYSLKYKLSGATTTGASLDGKSVNVVMEETNFAFNKAIISTNDIDADFAENNFNIESEITGLDDIKKVNFVEFDNANITMNVNLGELPLDFVAGNIEINLPDKFVVGNPTGGNATIANNVLTIPATSLNSNLEVKLPLEKINLNKDVTDGQILLNEVITYKPTGLKLRGENVSTEELLNNLSSELTINVACGNENGELVVKNSQVVANSVDAEINNSTSFEVNNKVDEAIKAIKYVELTDEAGNAAEMTLKINMQDFPTDQIQKGIDFNGLKVELPKFILFDEQSGVVDGVLTLTDKYNPKDGDYVKTLTVTGMDFTKLGEGYENGIELTADGYLMIPKALAAVNIKGKVKTVGEETINSEGLSSFTVKPSVNIPDMYVSKVTGKFDPTIDPVNENVALDLGDDLDFLKEEGAVLDINNPQIKIELQNTLGVGVDMALKIKGTDENGNVIDGSEVDVELKGDNGLAPAKADGTAVTTVFVLSKQGSNLADDNEGNVVYRNVKVDNLSDVMKRIPDNVDFNLVATVNQDMEHSVNLKQDLIITGKYDVLVPLAFDNLNINYSDTINNIKEDAADILEKAEKVDFTVKGDIENSIPLSLRISAEAMDSDGNALNNVKVAVLIDGEENGMLKIPANEGEAATSSIEIKITSVGTEIQKLDMIKWTVNAVKNEDGSVSTVGGTALNAEQYLKLKNLKASIKSLTLNLN